MTAKSPDGSGVLLHVEHLSRSVPERRIVDDVSFEARHGECVVIFGPSGSGKSSLLRLLNRMDEPTGGTVKVDGQDYRRIPPRELRRRFSLVAQRAFLFPGTVAQNISYGPRLHGEELPDAEMARLLESVGLGGYEGRDVAQLSGGEAHRVSLARALAVRPQALLLDEPTAALNEELKRQVESLVAELAARRRTGCIVVTHDRKQAARLARRVLLLEQGRAVRFGPAPEVLGAE